MDSVRKILVLEFIIPAMLVLIRHTTKGLQLAKSAVMRIYARLQFQIIFLSVLSIFLLNGANFLTIHDSKPMH